MSRSEAAPAISPSLSLAAPLLGQRIGAFETRGEQPVEFGDAAFKVTRLQQHQGKGVMALAIVRIGLDQRTASRQATAAVAALKAMNRSLELFAR